MERMAGVGGDSEHARMRACMGIGMDEILVAVLDLEVCTYIVCSGSSDKMIMQARQDERMRLYLGLAFDFIQ